jgi:hypothetical protein
MPLDLRSFKARAKRYVEREANTKVNKVSFVKRLQLFDREDIVLSVETTDRRYPTLWVGEALSDAVTVSLVGQLLFEFFEVVLAVGVLDVDEQLRPFSHDVISTAQQITGCAHGSGVGVGHREGASAEEGGDFFRIDSIVFAFAAMDSLHVEGMAQDEGDLFLDADIGEPVPDKHAFDGHRDIFAVWFDGPEECLG